MSNYDQLVGDYTNPILQPWASEVVKKFGLAPTVNPAFLDGLAETGYVVGPNVRRTPVKYRHWQPIWSD